MQFDFIPGSLKVIQAAQLVIRAQRQAKLCNCADDAWGRKPCVAGEGKDSIYKNVIKTAANLAQKVRRE